VSRKTKPTPLDVFEENISDAQRLVDLSNALVNGRKRRMRRELRESVGEAIGLPRKRRDGLDCVESDDLFVVLKPDGNVRREHFTETELRPLMRQAVVAIAAAVESYVAEKACCYIGEVLKADDPPRRLLDMPVTFEDLLWIEETYTRRGWGHRYLLEEYLRHEASADPSKIGQVFAIVGKRQFWKKVDQSRGVRQGMSEKELRALAERRNVIAHTGDRVGRGKAALEIEVVQRHLSSAKSIVEALDAAI
jgi:hypothetical protein